MKALYKGIKPPYLHGSFKIKFGRVLIYIETHDT